jgi:hypothetical protein
MQKSKPQSKQAPICTTIGMKLFSLVQHQSTFLKQLLKIKSNIDQSDEFVAWKIISPTHEHKLAKKTLRDGSNGELTLEDQKRELRSCTNVAEEDLTKTHVVDIDVHLT